MRLYGARECRQTTMGFRLTQAADEDVIGIFHSGLVQFGLEQADSYHDALFDVFDLIANNPRMGRERAELTPPVRVHPFRSHIILYMIEDADVLIVRVRHAHEDWVSNPV